MDVAEFRMTMSLNTKEAVFEHKGQFMEYKTHIVTTLVVGLPLMASNGQTDLLNIGMVALGSLLPDIDHPQSFLGKRNKIASGITNKTFGHRKATHSLLAIVVIYWLMAIVASHYLTSRGSLTPFWLTFGYLCHLLEDSFSQEGVNWLWPKKKRTKHNFGQIVHYKTGSLAEYLVFGLMLCLFLLELRMIWLGQLDNLLAAKYVDNVQKWAAIFSNILPFVS